MYSDSLRSSSDVHAPLFITFFAAPSFFGAICVGVWVCVCVCVREREREREREMVSARDSDERDN